MPESAYLSAPVPVSSEWSKHFRHKRRILTEEESQRVVSLYRRGATLDSLYRSTGIAPHILRRHLTEQHVEMPVYAYSNIMAADIETIIRLHKDGISMRKIGVQLGISHHTVKKCLMTNNLQSLSRGQVLQTRLSSGEETEMCRLYQGGMTLTALYGKFHVDRERAVLILTKHGITIRQSKDYPRDRPNHNPARGYSGYYKGWWFRSRDELAYALTLDARNHQWQSAEQKKFQIKYRTPDGKERFYYPDFIVDGRYLIEIKPDRFWSDPVVRKKAQAGRRFCKKNGLTYQMIDHPYQLDIIRLAYRSGLIQFTIRDNKYFKRFIARLNAIHDA